jgi:cytoskeletal protein RodZ
MVEFGEALRNAREASGISLEEIFERTRINIKHLRAIEAGDFPSVPQTYVRAFIREYARIVGLDEDETVSSYNEVAEREKGIPKPPEAIDAAHLLPHLDDSIEIITPGSVVPKHVEVRGKAEVEASREFAPPVRKSAAASAIESAPIDIRTTEKKKEQHAAAEAAPVADTAAATGAATVPVDEATTATGVTTHAAVPSPPSPPVQESKSLRSEILDKFARPDSTSKQQQQEQRPRRSVYATKHAHHAAATPPPAAPPPPVKKKAREEKPSIPKASSSEEKRILVIGSVVLLIVIVCVYAFFHFQAGETSSDSMVDSTQLKASLDAGKFIDSAQHMPAELPVIQPDTAGSAALSAAETPDPKAKSRAKEDSLILEAVSSAPVWFSVRMDTTRTERGSMSSNDHRVWKARDRFVITLGDAGAITFFLNGKELAPLGEEGAVIKNVTISRQQLGAGN